MKSSVQKTDIIVIPEETIIPLPPKEKSELAARSLLCLISSRIKKKQKCFSKIFSRCN